MTYWLNGPTGADLNHAMRQAATPYLAKLREQFLLARRQRDLAAARAIAAKYGMQITEDQSCTRDRAENGTSTPTPPQPQQQLLISYPILEP